MPNTSPNLLRAPAGRPDDDAVLIQDIPPGRNPGAALLRLRDQFGNEMMHLDSKLPQVQVLTPGSVLGTTGATNEGYRTTSVQLADMVDTVDTAVLMIDQIQLTNPNGATIKKTGIHAKSFTQPDNGGDTSAGLFVQTGGGGALTAYKVSSLRPTGYADYSSSPQGGIEAATGDKSQALLAIAGVFESTFHTNYRSDAIYARIDNASSGGVVVAPNDAVFNTRLAYAVGLKQNNAVPTSVTFSVTLAGALTAVQGLMLGAGQAAVNPNTTSLASAMALQDTGNAPNNGGFLVLGAQNGFFAGIKGLLVNGLNNTTGDMSFLTRNASTDTTLTERLRIKVAGDVVVNGGTLTFQAAGQLKTSAGNETTGSGSAALGANCPAVTVTAPFKWEQITTSDGSQCFFPVWK